MEFRQYYSERFFWAFNYTSKGLGYCLLKTLCLVVGLPLFALSFVIDVLFTVVNMLLCWIPILGVVVTVICKAITSLFGLSFYLCILTDLSSYEHATKDEPDYEVVDEVPAE